MLILSRRVEDSITIAHPDGPVVVKICGFDQGRVKMGITAPSTVKIMRTEVI